MADVVDDSWPFPRRKRSCLDRRLQQQRAQARVTSKLLSGFASLYHRGSCNTSLAAALEKALIEQSGKSATTRTSPTDDPRSQAATTQSNRKHSYLCKHYQKGFCKRGEDCLFSHFGALQCDIIPEPPIDGHKLSAHAPGFVPLSCLKKPLCRSESSTGVKDSLVFSAGVFVPDSSGTLHEVLGSSLDVPTVDALAAADEVVVPMGASTSDASLQDSRLPFGLPVKEKTLAQDEVVTLHFSNMSTVITVVANVHRPLRDALGVACAGFGMDPLAVQAHNIDMEVLRVHRTPRQISLAPEAQILVVPLVVKVPERDADDVGLVSPLVAAGSRRRISAKSSEVATTDPYSARKSTPMPSPATTPRDSDVESGSEPECATGLDEEEVEVAGALSIGSKVRVRDRVTEHWKHGIVVSLLPTRVALVGSKLAFTYAFTAVDSTTESHPAARSSCFGLGSVIGLGSG